jgi:uncharacterized protein involved in exopolysaccharide biosynthesis
MPKIFTYVKNGEGGKGKYMEEKNSMQNYYYDDEIDLREIFAVLWRWKWTIIGVTASFIIIAFTFSKFFMDPVYEARTIVAPASLNSVNGSSLTYVVNAENSLQWQMNEDMNEILQLPQVSIQNFNALLTSNHVIIRTRQVLELDQTVNEIRGRVQVKHDANTKTTEIVVSGTNPEENSKLANVLVDQTISYVKELNQQSMTTMLKSLESQLTRAEADLDTMLGRPEDSFTTEIRREREIERREQLVDLLSSKIMEMEILQSFVSDQDQIIVLSPATPPKNPVAPRVMLNTAVAAVLGFMLVIFAVFIIEYMRSAPNKDKNA